MRRKKYSGNRVFIVGAGPGPAGLLTLAGAEILGKADCVIYDRLVNGEILKYASKNAKLINADEARKKFTNGFTKEQNKLNNLIVGSARKYKITVRLKNGDPVIFGRLNEETASLKKNKVAFEIIPGITTASAAAASLKIGLTKTKIAPVVSFLTGHENPYGKKVSIEYEKLPLSGTLVFYMASENLKNIAKKLIETGRDERTPCAVVEKAGLSAERLRTGVLKNIKRFARGIKPPAVFLVGGVLDECREKK